MLASLGGLVLAWMEPLPGLLGRSAPRQATGGGEKAGEATLSSGKTCAFLRTQLYSCHSSHTPAAPSP